MHRTENISVMLKPDEDKAVRMAAALNGKTVSSFVRLVVLDHPDVKNFKDGVPFGERIDAEKETASA